ncbi:MAG: amidophosphoribosyltransferase, partial [Bacteroidales bacterium]|nr:amidophosphoribosyltransferase [Bacteroidales bacterium]
MSDRIKHECGIAMMRLLKPLDYYIEKYGTWDYGLQKMYLLLEKQHNRGQDGAGIAGLKPGVDIGNRYIFRERSNTANPIKDVFEAIYKDIDQHISMAGKDVADEPVINNNPYACNIYIGHVRYGTFGNYNIDYVHPVSRENNWRSRNLVLAGNFNLTNVRQLFDDLVDIGQYPVDYSDTVTILENIGHFLDEEVEGLFTKYKEDGFSKRDITPLIEANLNIKNVLAGASKKWDGGYTMAGMIGHGDAFVIRDPWGIRPAFYYRDDEVLVVASERPVIQTVFNLTTSMVNELDPGCGIIIKSNGKISIEQVREPKEEKKCSFERIYFSRGTDKSIYRERKMLGEQLTDTILRAVDYDIEHTVFSYIPNTAESAFFGLIKG